MKKETIYEYHNGVLGVKVSWLVTDKDSHPSSLKFIPVRTLRYHVNSQNFPEHQIRKPSKGHEALIEFDSLPRDWQEEITRVFGEPVRMVQKTFFESQYAFDSNAFNFFSNYLVPSTGKTLAIEQIDRYTYNASVLNAVLKVKMSRRLIRKAQGGSTVDIWKTLSHEVNNFRDTIPHTLPSNRDNLRKLTALYAKKSYIHLIDGRTGNMNAKVMDEPTLHLLNSMFANFSNKPTKTEIYRTYESFLNGYTEVVDADSGEVYQPKNYPKLSESTITSWLSKWENKIGTLKVRSGNKIKYNAQFKPPHRMKRIEFAGSMLSIDDRQPPFWYEKGKRLWFYIGVDLASEAIVAFVYGKSKEGILLEFYRQLVRNHAELGFCLPNQLECEMSLNSQYVDTFLKDGIMFNEVHIAPNNPREKRVEKHFDKLRYGYEKESEGFIARPFAKLESQQAGSDKITIIPYEQLVQARLKDLEDWNNTAHPHNESISRWEYYLENQHPKLTPINWKGFLHHIGHKTKTSCNVGYVILQGEQRMLAIDGQILAGDQLISCLTQIEGQDVTVYWLDGNDGEVLQAHVYYQGRFICELMPIPKWQKASIERTDEDKANKLIQDKYVATFTSFAQRQVATFAPVVITKKPEKTMNRKYKIPSLRTLEVNDVPVEEVPAFEDQEEEHLVHYTKTKSWTDHFKTKI